MTTMMSENIGELAKALAKAQMSMEHAKKTKTNPFHKNKYADLTDVWDVLKKPLGENGLAVVQLPATDGTYLELTTTLIHISGQWISSVFKVKSKSETAQEMGSALTYARRYTLAAITGNSSDEDDDGNSASGVYEKKYSPKPQLPAPKREEVKYIPTDDQKKIFAELCKIHGIDNKEVMSKLSSLCVGMNIDDVEDFIVKNGG